MSVESHESWLNSIKGSQPNRSKTFRILDPRGLEDTPLEVELSLIQDAPSASEAQSGGWNVDVRYVQAPSVALYTGSFTTQDEAQKVFTDLSTACAQVESLIKQQKFEDAEKAMSSLTNIFRSVTSDPPTNLTRGD